MSPTIWDRHMVNSSVADQLLLVPLVYLVLIRAPQQPASMPHHSPSLFFILFLPSFSCSSQTWQLPRRSTATPRTAPRRLPLWRLLRSLLPLRPPLRRALRPLRWLRSLRAATDRSPPSATPPPAEKLGRAACVSTVVVGRGGEGDQRGG